LPLVLLGTLPVVLLDFPEASSTQKRRDFSAVDLTGPYLCRTS
jgi:hypothetical protein